MLMVLVFFCCCVKSLLGISQSMLSVIAKWGIFKFDACCLQIKWIGTVNKQIPGDYLIAEVWNGFRIIWQFFEVFWSLSIVLIPQVLIPVFYWDIKILWNRTIGKFSILQDNRQDFNLNLNNSRSKDGSNQL